MRRQPFRSFRVCVSDGASYEVHHPETVAVSRTDVAIAVDESNGEVPERLVFCDPLHITRIEPLQAAKPKRTAKRRR